MQATGVYGMQFRSRTSQERFEQNSFFIQFLPITSNLQVTFLPEVEIWTEMLFQKT